MNEILVEICSRRPLRRFLCWRAPRSAPGIAITFDDGPCAGFTEQVLDTLRENDTRATFFVLGVAAQARPGLIRRMQQEGHEIALHGWDHSLTDLVGQARRCRAALKELGIDTNVFRPPGGRKIRAAEVAGLLSAGFRLVLWSFDTHDSMRHEKKWSGPPPEYQAMKPGDIILMHDDNPVCAAELPRLIQAAREKKLTPVRVSELGR